jgi:surfeit locus 1 family protein
VNVTTARSILTATIAATVGFTLLIGLGVWQLERKAWKENLIADLNARSSGLHAPPASGFRQTRDEFIRLRQRSYFLNAEPALVYTAGSGLRPDVSGPGYWVLAPANIGFATPVVINRGFIPAAQKNAVPLAPKGEFELTGALRWPEDSGLFTPNDDPQHNVWYRRDPTAIAKAKGWGRVEPFYIEQEAPQLPGAPKVGRLIVNLPDNHLQYAITWFGLAAALAGVYLLWLRGRWRKSA